jgi:hypothetical protein
MKIIFNAILMPHIPKDKLGSIARTVH